MYRIRLLLIFFFFFFGCRYGFVVLVVRFETNKTEGQTFSKFVFHHVWQKKIVVDIFSFRRTLTEIEKSSTFFLLLFFFLVIKSRLPNFFW